MTMQECGNLPHELQVKPDLPVELTCNVDIDDGLCNGSDGAFKCRTNDETGQDVLWIEFFGSKIGSKDIA